MQSQLVFQEKAEIERLAVQNRLLSAYEAPILEQLFAGGSQRKVLDLGCNDGKKTVERFASSAVSRVVGMEYNRALVCRAQEQYGSEKFSFYPCDVESPDFTDGLKAIMAQERIDGFDVIYLSFVLMHLANPAQLLQRLHPFLADGGCLLVIEPNDSASVLTLDDDGLLGEFLDILDQDRYSGNRRIGRDLEKMLTLCGYSDITLWHSEIKACPGETEKKKDIFQTFFSYLPEDVQILCRQEPDHPQYRSWSRWLRKNYEKLRGIIMQKESCISMGMQMISCLKGKK